jgi:hypothetical protein
VTEKSNIYKIKDKIFKKDKHLGKRHFVAMKMLKKLFNKDNPRMINQ